MRSPVFLLLALLALFLAVPAHAASRLDQQLEAAGENAKSLRAFLTEAKAKHGALGERAATFLVEGMPPRDLQTLDAAFLMENLSLALEARERFPWAKTLPEPLFFNDVLPYASLDETRESWRPAFFEDCAKLVAECKTATEAVQALNKGFFNVINVHYNTGRKAPNQSPAESKALGMATCTGLSIILVDACRAVGVPARIAGTPLWANKRGNHTWVEVYDNERWYFTGADEYNKKGLDKAWFTGDASKAIATDWRHAIWATSWKPTGTHFPMVWNLQDKSVPGVNVTARYARGKAKEAQHGTVYIRAWDKQGGTRLELDAELLDASGKSLQTVRTRGGTADLNDMASVMLTPGAAYTLRLARGSEQRSLPLSIKDVGESTRDVYWETLGERDLAVELVQSWLALLPEERHLSVPQIELSKADVAKVQPLLLAALRKEQAEARKAELEAKVVRAAGKEMKYLERTFGKAPAGKRSLYISMHGGGGAPARVNDQQWKNQIRLYAPKEGIVVAPRAPTNTWNLWHEGHIDDLFDRLIGNFVLERGVDPDRVYLLGYSAGGDGVYQLAPRMADRFAAASMMAGHPNDASPLGLRNLPFMIFMGGKDAAYDRNKVARQWGEKLAGLRKADEAGYEHKVTIYENLGHWMNGKDAEALPWMAARTREPWPTRVVWHQSGRTHPRFYWLAVPADQTKRGQTVRASVDGQTIALEAEDVPKITLRLHDGLVDLDQDVTILVNGKPRFRGRIARSVEALWGSLRERPDPRSAASAVVTVSTR